MHDISNKEVLTTQAQLIIEIKYLNKQTNNIYMNKQITAQARLNLNSIKYFTNIKMTFKNIFLNIMQMDITIFCLQMSIKIGSVRKQGKNLYKQTNNNYGWI